MSIVNGQWNSQLGNLFGAIPGSILGPMTNRQFSDLQNQYLAQLGSGLSQAHMDQIANLGPQSNNDLGLFLTGWTPTDEAEYQQYLRDFYNER